VFQTIAIMSSMTETWDFPSDEKDSRPINLLSAHPSRSSGLPDQLARLGEDVLEPSAGDDRALAINSHGVRDGLDSKSVEQIAPGLDPFSRWDVDAGGIIEMELVD
jgi:hypothetical protein